MNEFVFGRCHSTLDSTLLLLKPDPFGQIPIQVAALDEAVSLQYFFWEGGEAEGQRSGNKNEIAFGLTAGNQLNHLFMGDIYQRIQ